MKIILMNNLYGELARGGAERVVEAEAAALAADGQVVLVASAGPKEILPPGVCSPADSAACTPPTPGMVRTVRLHEPNLYFYPEGERHGFFVRFLWHLLDMFNFPAARRIMELLEKERPDVVHTHNLMGLGFWTPRTIRRAGLRHVHTVHDVQLLHPSGLLPAVGRIAWPSRLAQAAYVRIMRALMGSPDAVFFPSEFLKTLHEKNGFFPRARRIVLRNPAPAPASVGRQMPEHSMFLFAGQLEPHKGIRLLLDAWDSWTDKGAATLEIAGAGSLTREIRERLAGRPDVVMHGRLDLGRLTEVLGRTSFLVFPSEVIENAPSSITESLAAGTPIVAAATGGVPELAQDGVDGFLFPPGDASGCLASLKRAAALSAADWRKMSDAARHSVREMTTEKHLRILLENYGDRKDTNGRTIVSVSTQ